MINFIDTPRHEKIFENDNFFIKYDKYPVSDGHLLIISRRLVLTFFELDNTEKCDLVKMFEIAKKIIESNHKPTGYNIGMNCGTSAGQTVEHFHCHVIPRYDGDMENPKGGIRHCVEGKGYYN